MNNAARKPQSRGDADTCRRCNATILWAQTQNKKAVALNPLPTIGGGEYLVDGRSAFWLSDEMVKYLTEHKVELFQSHFDTCPKGWRANG